MKKWLTILLAMAMVLGLAAPALAYTGNVPAGTGKSLVALDIYLVDYTGGDFLSGMITKPATDRGYATNEIVAAVGSVTVPSGGDVYGEGYRALKLTGKNVTLKVTDNWGGSSGSYALNHTVPTVSGGVAFTNAFTLEDDDELSHPITDLGGSGYIPVTNGTKTYRFLVFGKVLAEEATLSIGLSRDAQWAKGADVAAAVQNYPSTQTPTSAVLNLGKDYTILQLQNGNFRIMDQFDWSPATGAAPSADKFLFEIEVGANGKTKGLIMMSGGNAYRVEAEPSLRQLVFWNTSTTGSPMIASGSREYNSLMRIYETVFEYDFGFTAYNKGNIMRPSDFQKIANDIDVKESVTVKPWTPYVQVPDGTIVNPPKTGDAASWLGFVFVLAAALMTVVVKKARVSEKAKG